MRGRARSGASVTRRSSQLRSCQRSQHSASRNLGTLIISPPLFVAISGTEPNDTDAPMRCAVLVLALAAGGDALLGPSLSARAGAPPAVRQLAHVVLRPPIREAHTAVQMAVRTEAQRAAFSGAKDTMDLKTALSRVAKAKATRVVAAVAAVLCAVFVAPVGVKAWVKALVGPKVPVVKALALKILLWNWNLFAGPAAQGLGLRVLTRLIDYGVPAAVIVFAIVMSGGDDDKAEDTPENPLKKLFKGGSRNAAVGAPAKEYIRIESLSEKLSSMEYTITARPWATMSPG